MARPPKRRLDHRGRPLPPGVYAQRNSDGKCTGYKIRWREATSDGDRSQYSMSFRPSRRAS
jgi:hypothetical protein